MKPILNSAAETDLYKLTQQAVVFEKFSTDRCTWAFR